MEVLIDFRGQIYFWVYCYEINIEFEIYNKIELVISNFKPKFSGS